MVMAVPSQKLMFTLLLVMMGAGVELLQVAGRPVDVNIINSLESQETLQVHCKDKHTDYGVHQVEPNQMYGFTIHPGFGADYFCGFVFGNVLHWFDVYLDYREWYGCARIGVCSWSVREDGPCSGTYPGECYPWNKDPFVPS